MDFLMLAMNQLVNMAAKMRYMFGGAVSVPLVVRAIIGRSWGQGAQHSQGLHAMFMHVPGLKVVAPTTPYDAKGCLAAAIRDDDPVIFVEHRLVHALRGPVPSGEYALPLGRARVLAPGRDVTIVGISHMIVECLRAARLLAAADLTAEVIDPVTLSPLDTETIVDSVRRTGRLLVVDTAWLTCGASAEIVTRVVERLQGEARPIRVGRLGFEPVTCPPTPALERLYYPDARRIARTAHALARPHDAAWEPPPGEAPEITGFKGPF
jgi:pyruvate/2-oxoglutarate/acetoin dehydrogenase E1 component